MAWNSAGWVMNLTLVDSGNNRVTKRFVMRRTAYADVVIDAAAVLAAIEAVSAASSLEYTLRELFVNDAFALPAAGIQIEAGAKLIMPDGSEFGKSHSFVIPAPETDVFVATTGDNANIVDIAHADVIDISELFKSDGECTISDGEYTDGTVLRGYRVTKGKTHG